MTAVFQSVGQALHIAFMVMAQEPRQGTPFRNVILQVMEALEKPTKAQELWMDQLRGSRDPNSTVDFSGLTMDEVRGQCAMVTQAVKDHLPDPEKNFVLARYIPTEMEETGRDFENKPKYRYYFSAERTEAIRWLGRWIQPVVSDLSIFQVDHLVAKALAERTEVRRTFRDLSQELGGSHMLYSRKYPKVKEQLAQIEYQAINRLTPFFEETGLVEERQHSC